MQDLIQTLSGLRLPLVALNLAGLVAALYLSKIEVTLFLKNFNKKTWLFLAGLLILQILAHALFVARKHMIYVDEFWYMNAARSILAHGAASDYQKSIGWPFLITFSFIAQGLNNYSAINLCILLGIFIPVNMFFLSFILTEDIYLSGASALMTALLPYNLVWSATAETVVPALFFMTLAMGFSAAYAKNKNNRLLWSAMMAWGMAAQIRPEILLFSLILTLFICRGELRPALLPAAAMILFNLANFAVFSYFQSSSNWLESDSYGALKGSNLSLSNLWFNSAHWAPKLLDSSLHPVLITITATAGLILMLLRRKSTALILSVWFIIMYLFYFSTWFHVYGTTTELFPKTKIFLLLYPVIIIFSCYAFKAVFDSGKNNMHKAATTLIFAICTIQLFAYGPKMQFRYTSLELETHMLSTLSKTVPDSCIIVANAPVIINATNSNKTVYSRAFLDRKDFADNIFERSNCVLFLDDITNRWTPFTGVKEELAKKYKLSGYAQFSMGNTELNLLKISGRTKT